MSSSACLLIDIESQRRRTLVIIDSSKEVDLQLNYLLSTHKTAASKNPEEVSSPSYLNEKNMISHFYLFTRRKVRDMTADACSLRHFLTSE